ncbi:hypothetical protein Trydic_g15739 [Trypoxylus dichotomus]
MYVLYTCVGTFSVYNHRFVQNINAASGRNTVAKRVIVHWIKKEIELKLEEAGGPETVCTCADRRRENYTKVLSGRSCVSLRKTDDGGRDHLNMVYRRMDS